MLKCSITCIFLIQPPSSLSPSLPPSLPPLAAQSHGQGRRPRCPGQQRERGRGGGRGGRAGVRSVCPRRGLSSAGLVEPAVAAAEEGREGGREEEDGRWDHASAFFHGAAAAAPAPAPAPATATGRWRWRRRRRKRRRRKFRCVQKKMPDPPFTAVASPSNAHPPSLLPSLPPSLRWRRLQL